MNKWCYFNGEKVASSEADGHFDRKLSVVERHKIGVVMTAICPILGRLWDDASHPSVRAAHDMAHAYRNWKAGGSISLSDKAYAAFHHALREVIAVRVRTPDIADSLGIGPK